VYPELAGQLICADDGTVGADECPHLLWSQPPLSPAPKRGRGRGARRKLRDRELPAQDLGDPCGGGAVGPGHHGSTVVRSPPPKTPQLRGRVGALDARLRTGGRSTGAAIRAEAAPPTYLKAEQTCSQYKSEGHTSDRAFWASSMRGMPIRAGPPWSDYSNRLNVPARLCLGRGPRVGSQVDYLAGTRVRRAAGRLHDTGRVPRWLQPGGTSRSPRG
jgi:hypothetical protein